MNTSADCYKVEKSSCELEKLGFELVTLVKLASNSEEIASYAVAVKRAVEKAVNDIVGSSPSDDCKEDVCKKPETIHERISNSNFVISTALKNIFSDLERL